MIRALLACVVVAAVLAVPFPLLAQVDVNDAFDDGVLSSDLWTAGADPGVLIAEQDGHLRVELTTDCSGPTFNGTVCSTWELSGPFDIQVDYELLVWPPSNGTRVGLAAVPAGTPGSSVQRANDVAGDQDLYVAHLLNPDLTQPGVCGTISTADTSGSLRLVRTPGPGNDVLDAYRWDAAASDWVLVCSNTTPSQDVYVYLSVWAHGSTPGAVIAFDNFQVNSGTVALPPYSPDPSIMHVDVYRGRDVSPEGDISYHEGLFIEVTDDDGIADIASVTVTDTEGGTHAAWVAEVRATSILYNWCEWSTPIPAPPGSYSVLVTDLSANSDSLTTAPAPPLAESSPELLSPPPDNSVILETIPTFCWTGSLPGAGDNLHVWGPGGGPDLWLYGTNSPGCVVFNSDGTATQPELTPGDTYTWQIDSWTRDDDFSDPRVAIYTDPHSFGRFTVYSPNPRVNHIDVYRGRDVSPEGDISYHEGLFIEVTDGDGIPDIASVTVTDTEGGTHAAWIAEIRGASVLYNWCEWSTPIPAPPGSYSVLVTDLSANSDSLTTAPAPPVAESSPELLSPPPDNSLILETIPTFCWTGSLPGAGDNLHVWGPGGGPDLWLYGTNSPGCVVFNSDGTATQPELIPGDTYTWQIDSWTRDDDFSDPRVAIYTDPHSFGRFAVYSPDPVIQRVELARGRHVDQAGNELYQECAQILVTDTDGWDHIVSVVTTDPGGNPRPSGADCSGTEVEGPYVLRARWASMDNTAPLPVGPYTVTASDAAGAEGSVTTVPVLNPPPVAEVIYPASDSLILETAPTFSWEPATGADYLCFCIRETAGAQRVIWKPRDLPGTTTSLLYNDDGLALEPQLVPGQSYELTLVAQFADADPAPHVTATAWTERHLTFTVYSPTPVIQNVRIQRGHTIDAEGAEYYQECAQLSVTDADGWEDVSITTLDPSGQIRPGANDCGGSSNDGPYTQNQYWAWWDQTAPLATGTYTVTALDAGGLSDVAAATALDLPVPPTITYPPNGTEIAETIPTFAWDSIAGAEHFCICLEEAGHNSPVPWGTWGIPADATSITYNGDGAARDPELTPGSRYRLHLLAWFADDDRVSDSRFSLWSYSEHIIEFWVAPKPEPVTGLQGKIVFERWQGSPDKLDIIDFSAPEPTPISLDLDGYWPHGGQTWSPDGAKITFSAFKPGEWEWGIKDIYVVNADGTGMLNLTDDAASDYQPSWSPDGDRILYSSNPTFVPDPGSSYSGWGCGNNLHTITADGTERAQLTFLDWPFATGEAYWSPDGTKIAFEHYQLGEDCRSDIAVVNADGSGLTLLTDDIWWDSGPRWSPDGSTIAFRSDRDGFSELYTMNPDGTDITRLTYYEGLVTGYHWAPDGQDLVVSLAPDTSDMSWGNGDLEIYVIDAAGGNPRRLTYNYWPDTNCSWWGPNTQPGSEVTQTISDTTITFEGVTTPGVTTATVSQTPPGPTPSGFQFLGDYYDISTDAEISGLITIQIHYDDDDVPGGQEEWLSLLHWETNHWEDITVRPIDTVNNIITGECTSLSEFGISVGPQFLGLLPPVNNDGSSIFKLNRTIPVKFQLKNADGSFMTDAVAQLFIAKVSDQVIGSYTEPTSTSAADTGNTFRYDPEADQYIFNLGTKGLSKGTWALQITVNGMIAKVVWVSLK